MPITLEDLKQELERLETVDQDIAGYEALVKERKKEKRLLETNILPDLYRRLGVKSMTTDSGAVAKYGVVATGKLPKDPEERQKAIDWLVREGYEGSIEAKVTAAWARGDREKALALCEQLRQDNSVKLALDEGMHWKTLGKLMKLRIIAGKEVDDCVGVEVLPRVRFTVQRENSDDEE